MSSADPSSGGAQKAESGRVLEDGRPGTESGVSDSGAPPRRPPSQRSPILSALSGALSFLLILALAGVGLSAWLVQRLSAAGPLAADKVVVIPAHTDVPDVVDQLASEGVIDDSLLFNAALILERKRSKVEAGEYLFKKSESMQSVLDTIVSGRQLLHSLTIPEGLTSEQIVDRLQADDALAGPAAVPAEGSLYPETYKFVRGASRANILREMQKDEDRALQEAWSGRDPAIPLKSPFELLTLASIVEKETGLATERPLVAAVFLNRLQRGMRLQSDPTVVYGLVGGKGTLGSGITRAQLEQPSPYNTYLIEGLPPGPISNPGKAALEAVAHPAKSDALYFVADGSGGHVFASTLAQHNRNVQHWREIEKAKAASGVTVDRLLPEASPSDAPAPAVGAAPATLPRPARGSDRHGALSGVAVFGSLPTSFSPQGGRPTAATDAFAALTTLSPGLSASALGDSASLRAAPKDPRGVSVSLGPSLDSLGVTLDDPVQRARDVMDGPAADPTPDSIDPAYLPGGSKAVSANRAPMPPINGRPRIIDASVGTPLDPLKNTSWDLNSPKTVPSSLN